MNIELKGKRALVTGGNSGIGAAIALAPASAGAKVAINYVAHPEATEKLMQKIKKTRQDDLTPSGSRRRQRG